MLSRRRSVLTNSTQRVSPLCRFHREYIPKSALELPQMVGEASPHAGTRQIRPLNPGVRAMTSAHFGQHRDDPFNILWSVRWYCRHPPSYRGACYLLAEPGVIVSACAVYQQIGPRTAKEFALQIKYEHGAV
jgi:hypothetical protein